MSYCVNCGVELADSEEKCPLCGVEVINPANPWQEPKNMPYPPRVERIMAHIDRRYSGILATIALSVPVLCSILIDIFMTRRISWSAYVSGAAVCLFVWFILPMLVNKVNVYLSILYDTAALQLYLADICLITIGVKTYLSFVMPLGFALCALAYASAPIICSKKLSGTLYKPAIILANIAVFCVLIELIIDLNLNGVFQPVWSLIAAAPCLLIGVMLILLEKKQKLKDKIRRRLFV